VQFHFHERGVDESPEKLAPDEAEAPDIEKDAEDVKACHLHDAASCEQYKQANVDGQKARGNARRNYLRRSCVEVFVYHLGQSLIIAYPLYPICKAQGAKLSPPFIHSVHCKRGKRKFPTRLNKEPGFAGFFAGKSIQLLLA
jgi:hypothetical protein